MSPSLSINFILIVKGNIVSDINNLDIQNKVYNFLDNLRESGEVNMFGATEDLMHEFPFMDKRKARGYLMTWMQNFGKDSDDG